MAKPVKTLANMTKNLTNAEKAARRKAEQALTRSAVNLVKPKSLVKDKKANYHWNRLMKEFGGIEILDNLDSDTLARYCKVLSRIEMLEDELDEIIDREERDKQLIRIESAERTQMTYATKLGLTPESRARLAKNNAKAIIEDDPNDDIYGGMQVIDCASGN